MKNCLQCPDMVNGICTAKDCPIRVRIISKVEGGAKDE